MADEAIRGAEDIVEDVFKCDLTESSSRMISGLHIYAIGGRFPTFKLVYKESGQKSGSIFTSFQEVE